MNGLKLTLKTPQIRLSRPLLKPKTAADGGTVGPSAGALPENHRGLCFGLTTSRWIDEESGSYTPWVFKDLLFLHVFLLGVLTGVFWNQVSCDFLFFSCFLFTSCVFPVFCFCVFLLEASGRPSSFFVAEKIQFTREYIHIFLPQHLH